MIHINKDTFARVKTLLSYDVPAVRIARTVGISPYYVAKVRKSASIEEFFAPKAKKASVKKPKVQRTNELENLASQVSTQTETLEGVLDVQKKTVEVLEHILNKLDDAVIY